jgi:perosamine synthetase
MEIPLSRPDISEADIEAVVGVLRTPYLSMGAKIEEFEGVMARAAGRRFGVAVSSGTAALHVIVRALGIKAGDEVVTSPFSFVASANCAMFEGARPVFVDIDPRTLNIDPARVERAITERTRAILAPDIFGLPCDWPDLEKIAKKHGLLLIEDSCEALGARVARRPAGSFGEAAAFAFYPNKQITTGEGGVVVTDREDVAQVCRSLRNQGRGPSGAWLEHERMGYNYRLDEMSAALGVSQMTRLDEILAQRARLARWYIERLRGIRGVETLDEPEGFTRSWFVFVALLPEGTDREDVMKKLRAAGVGCRDYFSPIHLQAYMREALGTAPGDFPVTEHVSRRTLALPFYTRLDEPKVDYVVATLKRILGQ